MPTDKNITTYGAANHNRKKGLKGNAGGDVRGVNHATTTTGNTAGHTYSGADASGGNWIWADTDTEAQYYPGLGSTYFGPPMWVSGGRYRKGDCVTVYESGVQVTYKCIKDHGVGGTYPTAEGGAGVTHPGSTTVPGSDATNWLAQSATFGLPRTQGGLNPGIPASVSAVAGATGKVTVSWTANKPSSTCTYEVVALNPDLYTPNGGAERLISQIMEHTYSDADDLTGLTANGDDYQLTGSGWVTTTGVAGSTGPAADLDVRPIGIQATYEVVVGVRAIAEADTTGTTRQDVGRRGPWVWTVCVSGA